MGKKGKVSVQEAPDDFAAQFAHYMELITPKTKLNVNDVEEMRVRFANYINATKAYKMEFGNINCYYALGLTDRQIRQFIGPKYHENPDRAEFLKAMKFYLGAYREQCIAKGYLAPMSGIFQQKNFDDMIDVQEIAYVAQEDEVRDIKSIASRYVDVIDVEFKPKKQIGQKAQKAEAEQKDPQKEQNND